MAPTMLPPLSLEEKILPESFVRSEAGRPKVAYDASRNEILVISLAELVDDNAEGSKGREEMFKKLVKACEEWGVFQVVDHGVDQGLIDDMLRLTREFFAHPAEEKLKYFDTTGGRRGGYLISSHLHEKMKVHDWREFMTYFTYPVQTRELNQWPDKPEGWHKVIEDYSEQLMGMSHKLLEVLSVAMGLDKEAIAKACVDMDQKVLPNFYPKCPQPDLTYGLRQHTDPGTITILLQDRVGGLQVTNDGGKTWATMEPVHGAFVVNIGDHGHILSNGKFKSCVHRAVVNSSDSRVSVGAFQYPSQECMVYPLIVGEGEKPILEAPITFKEMYSRKMHRDKDIP